MTTSSKCPPPQSILDLSKGTAAFRYFLWAHCLSLYHFDQSFSISWWRQAVDFRGTVPANLWRWIWQQNFLTLPSIYKTPEDIWSTCYLEVCAHSVMWMPLVLFESILDHGILYFLDHSKFNILQHFHCHRFVAARIVSPLPCLFCPTLNIKYKSII